MNAPAPPEAVNPTSRLDASGLQKSYGARKVVYASMGLGFADPTDFPAR